jgi:GNAT superfamily N-acetyltransferase
MNVEIRPADLAQVRRVRHLVLRPHQRPEDLVYGGDDGPGALHLGAFEADRLVAIASITREPPPGSEDAAAWRVRGMATLPELRGRGIGGELLETCVAHARSHGGSFVWCNGRIGARAFYGRHGFAVARGPFEIPGIGPHVELRRSLR